MSLGYRRADWKSVLIYRQTCEQCKVVVAYKDTNLGYRPWFADGFVYCPVCKNLLDTMKNLLKILILIGMIIIFRNYFVLNVVRNIQKKIAIVLSVVIKENKDN